MKRQILLMMAAIMTLCCTAPLLVSCSSDDDDTPNNNQEAERSYTAARAEVTYTVSLGANTLELADVEVTYDDENGQSKSFLMTENLWTLKRTLTATQMPADFSLQVSFEQKSGATTADDKDYEFGCVSRIPFTVYDSKGNKICEHPGTVAETDGSHPVMKGSQMTGWWLTYHIGINPDKLINFDKKTLQIKTDEAVFNDMSYKYPYLN